MAVYLYSVYMKSGRKIFVGQIESCKDVVRFLRDKKRISLDNLDIICNFTGKSVAFRLDR